MKKIVYSLLLIGFAGAGFAQEVKKVQAGLAYQLGFGFNKPTTKLMEKNGVGIQNTIGLQLNFNFTEKIGLATGLEFDFESMKYKTGDSAVFYAFTDTEILKKEQYSAGSVPTGTQFYQLSNRKYNATYITIPTMLMFNMKPLGAFTPYGKFGARTSVVAGAKIQDQGKNLSTGQVIDNNDMKAKSDLFFLRSEIGIAGGTQWEFSGGTCLFAEMAFYYGFTPTFYGEAIAGSDKERDMHLFTVNSGNGTSDYFTNKASQKHFAIKLGILF